MAQCSWNGRMYSSLQMKFTLFILFIGSWINESSRVLVLCPPISPLVQIFDGWICVGWQGRILHHLGERLEQGLIVHAVIGIGVRLQQRGHRFLATDDLQLQNRCLVYLKSVPENCKPLRSPHFSTRCLHIVVA